MTSRDNNQAHIPSRLAISAAVATALLTGYGGRKAYADCTGTGAAGTYTCSGVTTTIQTLPTAGTSPLTVTTNPGFSITTAGSAFELFGNGGLTFTDHNASTIITGYSGNGIYAVNNGTGALSITSNGAVTGRESGIVARNNGTGTITITHSGAVTGTTGIKVDDRTNNSPATINSFAPITGTGGFAIDLRDEAHDVVNLGVGSVITGSIDFGNNEDTDVDTLNVAIGTNMEINFEDASGNDSDPESAPENVSSNIALINGGTTAVAFDPSGFAAPGLFLGSFTNAIFNSIDNGGVTPGNGSASNSFTGLQANGLSQRHWVSGLGGRQEIKTAGNSGVGGLSANGVASPYALDFGSLFWVSVFGGQQAVEAADNNVDLDHDFVGLMAGAESNFNSGTLGLFGGYGTSDVAIAYEAGSTETDSLFAGAYWKKDYGTYRVNLALIAGLTDQEFRREINGATPVTAKGETDGWFISPSATFTVPITALPITTLGSVRVSYAGLFLDDYTETGVANPLTVSDRDIHLFNTRAQLAFPHDFDNEDGSSVHLEVRAGVDAQYNLDSDEVSGVVGGTPINFSVDLDDRVSGFVGATLIRTNQKEDLTFAISGEVQSTFDGGYEAVGELKVVKRF